MNKKGHIHTCLSNSMNQFAVLITNELDDGDEDDIDAECKVYAVLRIVLFIYVCCILSS